jgi:hypothetical protein
MTTKEINVRRNKGLYIHIYAISLGQETSKLLLQGSCVGVKAEVCKTACGAKKKILNCKIGAILLYELLADETCKNANAVSTIQIPTVLGNQSTRSHGSLLYQITRRRSQGVPSCAEVWMV